MAKLTSFEEMFGEINNSRNQTTLPIELLVPYSKHEYRLYEGERFDEMVDSIKTYGIIQPIIVRPLGDKYEILTGHNRTECGKAAGLSEVPVIIIDVDDNLAGEIVDETNLQQRSFADMKISEKASIIEKHYNKLKKQGKRQHFTDSIDAANKDTRDYIASEYGITGRDLSRLMRINHLIQPLKDMVDKKELPFIAAVNLSYLDSTNQIVLDRVIKDTSKKCTLKHSESIKKLNSEDYFLLNDPEDTFIAILNNKFNIEKKGKDEIVSEEKYPQLKNDEERFEFLENYDKWGEWYFDKKIGAQYFKFSLPNETNIIVVRHRVNGSQDYLNSGFTPPTFYITDKENPSLSCYNQKSFKEVCLHLKTSLPPKFQVKPNKEKTR